MQPKRQLDPRTLPTLTTYKVLTGSIVPRPIGLVSTVGADGVFNAAPFSFFNGISHLPPMVCFSAQRRDDRQKDTILHVTATRDFVVNIVDEALGPAMAACAVDYPVDVSEFERAGLTAVASRFIKSPAIAEAPVNMECTVVDIVPLPESTYTLVIGRVILFHVRTDLCASDGKIDSTALLAVGRMAGNQYTRTRDAFTMDSHLRVT
jgi:flavin reductase (DIM6/NTAB) family NADH-FMN oxidoreductase RutF